VQVGKGAVTSACQRCAALQVWCGLRLFGVLTMLLLQNSLDHTVEGCMTMVVANALFR
jgi:hypothetical protein